MPSTAMPREANPRNMFLTLRYLITLCPGSIVLLIHHPSKQNIWKSSHGSPIQSSTTGKRCPDKGKMELLLLTRVQGIVLKTHY